MGLISDVTDQKITQETMAVHQIELEERVRRRTQELMRANQVLELEIEQRKEAESELKKSEAQYRAMAANFPNGAVILFDRELRYRIADGLGLEEVGLSQSVLEGRTIFEVFPPEVYEQIEPRYRAVLAGRIQAFEMEYGGRFYQVRCVPVRDENGRVAWGLVMTQDISREREAAEKLEAAFREVEQKNRELELFAYAASHDLKSPLRAISSLSQWLEEDLGPVMKKPQRDQMELLRRRVKRMEALIDGLLAYSRVGRFPESPVELNVGEVLQRVIGTVNPPPGFEVRTPPEPPVLVADELRLAQVFQNLIDNAVKYHPGPQGTITIESDRVDGHWRFCVRDDGPGIAPRFQERVFQMFQTLQSRDEVESTGIGLPLIKKIVESKGGRVWVESEGRNGAAFFFTWPDREENESNV
jgi:PAS domain S-box-containing protein